MFTTSAPDITNDATIGQVITVPTATATSLAATSTPTPTAVATSSPKLTASPKATSTPTPETATPKPFEKKFRLEPLTIFGYGPADSEVVLNGIGVSEKVKTTKSGFFRFTEIYSYTYSYPELCLQSKDLENRITQPVCIPAFPSSNLLPKEIGPILLSPTISVSTSRVGVGEPLIVSGHFQPDSDILISLAEDQGFSLVEDVSAYFLPSYSARTDKNGDYQIQLPTSATGNYRIFAFSKNLDNQTSKSNTLTFKVISSTYSLWESILRFILENKITLLMVLELLVIMFLGTLALKSNTKRKKSSLNGDDIKKRYIEILYKNKR